jgi:hypothetical protein
MSGAAYVAFCHYVDEAQRTAWESYTGLDEANYLPESYEYFDSVGIPYFKQTSINPPNSTSTTLPIFKYTENITAVSDTGPGPYLVSYVEHYLPSGKVLYLCQFLLTLKLN